MVRGRWMALSPLRIQWIQRLCGDLGRGRCWSWATTATRGQSQEEAVHPTSRDLMPHLRASCARKATEAATTIDEPVA
jgi:hypothetical protein